MSKRLSSVDIVDRISLSTRDKAAVDVEALSNDSAESEPPESIDLSSDETVVVEIEGELSELSAAHQHEAELLEAQRKLDDLQSQVLHLQDELSRCKDDAERDKAASYEKGYADGKNDTEKSLSSKFDEQSSGAGILFENLKLEVAEFFDQLDDNTSKVASAILDKITGDYFHSSDFKLALIKNVISKFPNRKLIIGVCADDYHLIASDKLLAEDEDLQFIIDKTVKRGGCIVQAEGVMWDATLEHQLSLIDIALSLPVPDDRTSYE